MSVTKRFVVAVDGGAGVGKGTLCQALAQELGFAYLDSGALYRLLAFTALEQGLHEASAQEISALVSQMDLRFEMRDGAFMPCLKGRYLGAEIRNERVAAVASKIAAYPEVRSALLDFQRHFSSQSALVADGRDMGTVVFPEAEVKLFLTASLEVRATRRLLQLKAQGEDAKLEELTREIAERDERDRQRTTAPLKPAADAVVIDTSFLSIHEVLKQAKALILSKINP
ncbi:MAG: (d)CMP kinase [Cardiobacteriaceae bacterium]|nr:(d)CMP kinase [Cardiobacteriaceae bacterium]